MKLSDKMEEQNEECIQEDHFSADVFSTGGGRSKAITIPKHVADQWKIKDKDRIKFKIIGFIKRGKGGKKNGKRKTKTRD